MASDSLLSNASTRALILAAAMALGVPVQAQDGAPNAWRVECSGDGKTLDCRAVQQMINREDKQLVVQLTARITPETKTPALALQLPLGINLAEPIQIKVDDGTTERYPVQTCTAAGCFVTLPLKDTLLAAMRTGVLLKINVYDATKRTITIEVPLLGFGLAFDKATK